MVTTTRWDAADYLDSEERIAGYLDAVLEDGDPALLKAALNDVARARGMTELAEKAGISRAGLYKALGEDGNPSFATVVAIMRALGVRLAVTV